MFYSNKSKLQIRTDFAVLSVRELFQFSLQPPPFVKSTESGSQSLVPFFFVFYARTINGLHKTEDAGQRKLPNPMPTILACSRPFFSLFLCRVGNSSQAQIKLKSSRGRGSKEQCKRCLTSTQRTVLEMMSTRLAC